MSKLRIRRYADGYWSATHPEFKGIGRGPTPEVAEADMRAAHWFTLERARQSAMLRNGQRASDYKSRLNTWRSIAIAQFVVIVATGAIMWIGG